MAEGKVARDATEKSDDCGKATAGMWRSLGNYAEQLIAHRDSHSHHLCTECADSLRCYKHFHDIVLRREVGHLEAGSPLAGVFFFRSALPDPWQQKVPADRHLPHGRRPLYFRERTIASGARKGSGKYPCEMSQEKAEEEVRVRDGLKIPGHILDA